MGRLALCLSAAVLAGACGDPGRLAGPCGLSAGSLVGCEPEQASDEVRTIADACWKMVECGVLFVSDVVDSELDYPGCVARLSTYFPERLAYALHCIDAATCAGLATSTQNGYPFDGTCFQYGGERP